MYISSVAMVSELLTYCEEYEDSPRDSGQEEEEADRNTVWEEAVTVLPWKGPLQPLLMTVMILSWSLWFGSTRRFIPTLLHHWYLLWKWS